MKPYGRNSTLRSLRGFLIRISARFSGAWLLASLSWRSGLSRLIGLELTLMLSNCVAMTLRGYAFALGDLRRCSTSRERLGSS